MKSSSRSGNILGLAGVVLLGTFWLANLWPQRVDALLRPYGLFMWLVLLVAAIVLPSIAAVRSSRWWLILTCISLFTAVRFALLLGE
jgi:hypothetical protein